MTLTEIPIWELPLFNQEIQEQPTPVIERFWGAVREADAILFISPEYNYSVPGRAQERDRLGIASARVRADRRQTRSAFSARRAAAPARCACSCTCERFSPASNMAIMPKPEVFIMAVGDAIDKDGKLARRAGAGQLFGFYEAFEQWIRKFKTAE